MLSQIIWNFYEERQWSKKQKVYLFLLTFVMMCFIIGGSSWFLVGRYLLKGFSGLVCFMGYPAFFIGFLGGILFLYNK